MHLSGAVSRYSLSSVTVTVALATLVGVGRAAVADTRSAAGKSVATSCPPLTNMTPCSPARLEGFIPCTVICDGSGITGESCRAEIWMDSQAPSAPPIGVETWWIVRSRVDGQWHFIFVEAYGLDFGHSPSEFVLCDDKCWADIVGFGWNSFGVGEGDSRTVYGKLVNNTCTSCQTPTPVPHTPVNRPNRCVCPVALPVVVRDPG
jgi:hypothetical protein